MESKLNYDGNGYDSEMYPEEYKNNHLDTIIGIDHDRWMDVISST